MKRALLIIPALIMVACGGQEANTRVDLRPYDFTYAVYARVLSGFVVGDRVDYARLVQNRALLDSQVDAVAHADLSAATESQKLAFYINAYNILTLRSIVDAYPVNSIKDVRGVWDKTKWPVAGDEITLNEIEHEILRKKFAEPRIHIAINCASKGCPPLLNAPYYPDSLDQQLETVSRRFATSPAHNRINLETGAAELSSIFDWFGDDFVTRYYDTASFPGLSKKENGALNFVMQNRSQAASEIGQAAFVVSFHEYDWSLNDVE